MGASIAVARLGGRAPAIHGLFTLSLLLGVLSYSYHAFVVAVHAVDALAGFGKDKLVDALLADLAFEAVGVVRVVAGHDRLVEDGLATDIAAVGAVGAYRGAIGQQEQVCVGGDLLVALCALEAINVEV